MTAQVKLMKTVVVGGKELFVSEPYRPKQSAFVGRESETALIMAAWTAGLGRAPLNPLLTGEPGVGKNRLVYECAQVRRKPLFIVQGHEDLTPEDLACSVRFSDDRERKMDYILSPLVTAMIDGGVCLVDEIGKMRPKAMAMLSSLLDERRYIDSSILGVRINAHPEFCFVAATNSADLDGNAIPDYIQSRLFPVIRIDGMSKREIESIVLADYEMPGAELKTALSAFFSLHDREGIEPTPRIAVSVFSLASSLSARSGEDGLIKPSHIEQAFSLLRAGRTSC